ncbi:MAG: hypothetical protein P1V36_17955, partial [Planctomycetota bacterium]|nr:hypothetical protein [Planctomycetota bacterium]
MTDAATGVRTPMDDLPVDRRRTALLLALGAVLVAGQPAFLGEQVFSTGGVLRGVLYALLCALALLAAWQAASTRPALGRLGTTLLLLPLGVALLGLPAFGEDWGTVARAGRTWILPPLLAYALLASWRGPRDAARGLQALALAGGLGALAVL